MAGLSEPPLGCVHICNVISPYWRTVLSRQGLRVVFWTLVDNRLGSPYLQVDELQDHRLMWYYPCPSLPGSDFATQTLLTDRVSSWLAMLQMILMGDNRLFWTSPDVGCRSHGGNEVSCRCFSSVPELQQLPIHTFHEVGVAYCRTFLNTLFP